MIHLTWRKCGNGSRWCSLEDFDPSAAPTATGVFIIWHDGHPGHVVCVGQGDIAQRLAALRNDPQILAFSQRGTLRVTWAAVPSHQSDGVVRFLAEAWSPLIAGTLPAGPMIAVSSPFAA